MKIKNCSLVLIVTVLLMVQPAWGMQVTNEPGSLNLDSSDNQTRDPERSGEIDNMGPGGKTIVVDGKTYLFDAASVIVHSDNPSVPGDVNQLNKGSHIGFATKAEGAEKMERITEIWLMGGNDAK